MSLHPIWRRSGPSDQEIERKLDLFRRGFGLSLPEGAKRGSAYRHMGRRSRRHGKTYPSGGPGADPPRSEEHTSELQSLMRISYAVFCLKKKKNKTTQ